MFKISVTTDKNECLDLDVLAVFHNDKNEKYLAYNDGSKTDGKLNIIVSRYEEKDGKIDLFAVETDEQWAFVNDYLDKNLFEVEND